MSLKYTSNNIRRTFQILAILLLAFGVKAVSAKPTNFQGEYLETSLENSCDIVTEIMILIDESSNISASDFLLEKNFSIDLINSIELSTNLKIGIANFGTDGRLISGPIADKNALLFSLSNMNQHGGENNIIAGLNLASDQFSLNSNSILLIFTGGYTLDTSLVAGTVNNINVASGTTLLTAGIGSNVSQAELEAISSPDLIFNIGEFASLTSSLASLINSANCSPGPEPGFGEILYAGPASPASGFCDSWENACDLQYALSNAVDGTEIWVMAGTYYPGTTREDTFHLKSGVLLFGGFNGTERNLIERDPISFVSTLSGRIWNPEYTGNSYHVVTGSGTDNTAVLDGFTITAGEAQGDNYNAFGAGMFIESGNPTLVNIKFIGNYSVLGGGMHLIGSNPTLTEVTFQSNIALWGGGIYMDRSSPHLTNVSFINNVANGFGGGIFNDSGSPSLYNVNFSGNSSHAGGGLYTRSGFPTLGGVTFVSNIASADYGHYSFGGGIYNESGSLTLSDGYFEGNIADYGGGVFNDNDFYYFVGTSLDHVSFIGNSAIFGGGLFNSSSNPTLSYVTFSGNVANFGGGVYNTSMSPTGLYYSFSNPHIYEANFLDNHAEESGGGIFSLEGEIWLNNVLFSRNTSFSFGGGVFSDYSDLFFWNVTMNNNESHYGGGGLYSKGGNSILNNITINGNLVPVGKGSEIFIDENDLTILNSILWGTGEDIIFMNNSAIKLSDSIIKGGCPTNAVCENVNDENPLLGNLGDHGGFSQTIPLLPGSPAIDAGDNLTCAVVDQRGVERPQMYACDQGAYEWEPPEFLCEYVFGIPVQECEALVDLYNSTNGENWANNAGWLETYTPCSDQDGWNGISCLNGHVRKISLPNNNLAGLIPSSIGNLDSLYLLHLQLNHLSGPLPAEIGSLTNLVYLNLHTNQLSGPLPGALANLVNLNELYLYSNDLTGPIPSLEGFNSLVRLGLADNQFDGEIPASLGSLENLISLSLDRNALTGSIPPQLGQLSHLERLSLFSNQLSGPIPTELGHLNSLMYLNLYQNQLSGQIPASLGNLTSLANLYLSGNQFTGELPAELGSLENLTILQLNHNLLTGPVPISFTNINNLTEFTFNDTHLCEPQVDIFQTWLLALGDSVTTTGISCDQDDDGDGVTNRFDNAPQEFNPDQSDIDGDGLGDVSDPCPSRYLNTCDPQSSESASIGSEGGRVDTSDGQASIVVVEGALKEDTSMTVEVVESDFKLETSLGDAQIVSSVIIGPEGTEFDEPVTVILSWADADNDGWIDGSDPALHERYLVVTHNGEVVTGQCRDEHPPDGTLPDCDPAANTFTFEITHLSQFTLSTLSAHIAGPEKPIAIGRPATITVEFPDQAAEHHTTWNWDDGESESVVLVGSTASYQHVYQNPGVYEITLTLDQGTVTERTIPYSYIVVYDPENGFVTGGGWIESSAGAFLADPTLTGKATFGFVSKYKKGATVPTGSTEFQFKAGDLNFRSINYEWLVVNQGGSNAQFKGEGSINGDRDINGNPYKFTIWAGDGAGDTFRIRIWIEDEFGNETDIYDNGVGQEIGGGSIVIHQ